MNTAMWLSIIALMFVLATGCEAGQAGKNNKDSELCFKWISVYKDLSVEKECFDKVANYTDWQDKTKYKHFSSKNFDLNLPECNEEMSDTPCWADDVIYFIADAQLSSFRMEMPETKEPRFAYKGKVLTWWCTHIAGDNPSFLECECERGKMTYYETIDNKLIIICEGECYE